MVSACALWGALAATGAEVGVEDRFRAIEAQLEALKKENAELKSQIKVGDKSAEGGKSSTAPVTVKVKGKESNITLGGMLQTQFEAGDTPDPRFSDNDRFLLRRARLNIAGSFLENFAWKLEGEFGNGNLKNNSSYRAYATDAYIHWTKYDFANVKVGQFKTLFGYEQLMSDSVLFFAERSLPTDRFTASRQLGAAVSGDYYNKRLGYAVGVFNGNAQNNGFNDNEKFAYAGRLTGTPWKGKLGGMESQWSLGVNAYLSKDSNASIANMGFDSVAGGSVDDTFKGDRRVWAADTQFQLGRFDVHAEYFRGHYKPINNIPVDKLESDGFYVTVAAFILPKKLQAVVKYETVNTNVDVDGDSSDAWVFGLNYYIRDHDLKLQLNYHLGSSEGAEDHQGRIIARAQLLF